MEVNLPFSFVFFVFEGNFPLSTNPGGAYIWRGDLTEGFLRHRIGGLIFEGAYTWKGLFSEFYGIIKIEKLHVTTSLQNSEEFVKNQALINLSRQVL